MKLNFSRRNPNGYLKNIINNGELKSKRITGRRENYRLLF
jgi:hypothetical protein